MLHLKKIACICCLSIGLTACYYDSREVLYPLSDIACDPGEVSFSVHIVPIMQAHCTSCHNTGDPQGNVNLEGYTQVLIHANNGSLYGSIAHDAKFSPMPSAAQKIPSCNIVQIKTWVDAGAANN